MSPYADLCTRGCISSIYLRSHVVQFSLHAFTISPVALGDLLTGMPNPFVFIPT